MGVKPVVSHSEAESFLTCELRHYYAFVDKLEKIDKGTALFRGIVGHNAFEVFFNARKKKMAWNNAINLMIEFLSQELMKAEGKQVEVIGQLAIIMPGFLEHFKGRIESWEVIAVEETYRIEFQDFTYPFTVDYYVKEKTGEFAVFDSKFTYDFYKPQIIQLLPQLPKYAGGLRVLGYPVDKGYYSFIRYRNLNDPNGNNTYAMYPVDLDRNRVKNAFGEQLRTALKIAELKTLTPEVHKEHIERTASKRTCEYCPFLDICVTEQFGRDSTLLRKTEYQTSTYGYSGVIADV